MEVLKDLNSRSYRSLVEFVSKLTRSGLIQAQLVSGQGQEQVETEASIEQALSLYTLVPDHIMLARLL